MLNVLPLCSVSAALRSPVSNSKNTFQILLPVDCCQLSLKCTTENVQISFQLKNNYVSQCIFVLLKCLQIFLSTVHSKQHNNNKTSIITKSAEFTSIINRSTATTGLRLHA